MTKIEDNLLEWFGEYLVAERGLSPSTVRAYHADLRCLASYMDDFGLELEGIDRDSLLAWLRSRGLQSRTLARHLCAYKSFCNFLVSEGVLSVNPIADLKLVKCGERSPFALGIQELESMINVLRSDRTKYGLQALAMFELLYSTGLRVSEMLALKIVDVFKDGIARTTIVIRGKGARDRFVIVNDVAREALGCYREFLDSKGVWLFPSRHKRDGQGAGRRPLSRQCFFNLCRRISGQVGVRNFSPHVMRHTFATHMIRNGLDVRVAQELLGHKSIDSTQIYTKLTADEILQLVLSKHPIRQK